MVVLSFILWPVYVDAKEKPKVPQLVFDTRIKPEPLEINLTPLGPPKPPETPRPRPQVKAKDLGEHKASDWGGWCVDYAKKRTGKYGTWGNGGRLLSLTQTPQVGAVVVFNYTHVAVIDILDGPRMKISESNYEKKMRISSRWISVTDPSIRGFHIP